MKVKNISNKNIIVGTLQDIDPTTEAYLLARYSRSRESMPDTINYVMSKGVNPEDRFKKIVNYGHSSVRGMGHFPCFVEGTSILESLRFFYNCPLQDGQESSTRYIDFSKQVKFLKPSILTKEYESICNYLYNSYSCLLRETISSLSLLFNVKESKTLKVRAIDCARYLLPLATKTGFGAIQSGREWSRYIKYLKGLSEDSISKLISDQLSELLTQEYPALVNHLEALPFIEDKIIKLILTQIDIEDNSHLSLMAYEVKDSSLELLNRFSSLISPNNLYTQTHLSSIDENIKRDISSLIFDNFNHHNEMGIIGRDGCICVKGMSDIGGTIKDLNRHRSINRFIPFLHPSFNLDEELNRNSNLYELPPYLDNLPPLKTKYIEVLDNTYSSIIDWYSKAKDYMELQEAKEWTKRLLPNAHRTQFAFYGSIKDWLYLTRLRIRPGGHISYRVLAGEIAEKIANINPLYSGMKIDKPNTFDTSEFLNRS